MKKTLLVCLAFVGIFVAGGVTGGFIAARMVRQVVQQRALLQFNRQQLRHYADVLELTPFQREQIRGIILRSGRNIQSARREMNAASDQMMKEISSVLTPEQRVKFEELSNRQRERERVWQRWIRELRQEREQPPQAVPPTPAPVQNSSPSS